MHCSTNLTQIEPWQALYTGTAFCETWTLESFSSIGRLEVGTELWVPGGLAECKS